jgi:hypothetical protein
MRRFFLCDKCQEVSRDSCWEAAHGRLDHDVMIATRLPSRQKEFWGFVSPLVLPAAKQIADWHGK